MFECIVESRVVQSIVCLFVFYIKYNNNSNK